MGKNLVIKGADFSENAIEKQTTWLVDEYDQLISGGGSITSATLPTYAGFAPNFDFGGKTINTIKGYANTAGNVTLWLGNSVTDSSAVKVAEFEIESNEVDSVVTKLFTTINVPEGKKLWICKITDTGAFGYNNTSAHPSSLGSFWVLLGTSSAHVNYATNENLALNWGYTG